MGTLVELAYKLRPYIEKAVQSLDDEDAIEAISLFPLWGTNKFYNVGDRARFDNALYRCLQSHTSLENWTPTAAPSLWTKVLIPNSNIIPEWEQPDSTNAYKIGDRVRYNGKVWENTIPNNIWMPGVYGWVVVNI